MIQDLSGKGTVVVESDVVVIGAGTAGLIVAVSLARKGLSVTCLESGGWNQAGATHPLNEVVQTGSLYGGAARGRFRCLGGTSTRWGGALIPFVERDVRGWPIAHSEMIAYLPQLERLFGLSAGPYDAPDILGAPPTDHLARLAKWPPFANRNVFNLLRTQARSESGPRIWLNATATEFRADAGGLRSIVARAPDGSQLTARSRRFVLCAGAIESTRLLLLLQQQNAALIPQNRNLGHYLHDHLSVPVADLEVIDRSALNRVVGFRFEAGGAMRNVRFELAAATPLRESLPAGFAHVAFEDDGRGGFDALRDLLRRVQQRRLPSPGTLRRLLAATPWLLRLIWWRYAERRLLYPGHACITVHMVIEQQPRVQNCITLSAQRTDSLGQPLAQIHWTVGPEDVRNLRRSADAFGHTWKSSVLSRLAVFRPRPADEIAREIAAGGGIYHPGGTTRLGRNADEGVVDTDLRLFGCPEVRVVATSVLPTGGGANPTMMLLLLALRCVDDLLADRHGAPKR